MLQFWCYLDCQVEIVFWLYYVYVWDNFIMNLFEENRVVVDFVKYLEDEGSGVSVYCLEEIEIESCMDLDVGVFFVEQFQVSFYKGRDIVKIFLFWIGVFFVCDFF